ncbi:hypothetical protein GF362_04090 [Candidatus Dojkabacteria bacterium]|nr:hypothetical protein [Candidatus Dojkabacteria bacterium]
MKKDVTVLEVLRYYNNQVDKDEKGYYKYQHLATDKNIRDICVFLKFAFAIIGVIYGVGAVMVLLREPALIILNCPVTLIILSLAMLFQYFAGIKKEYFTQAEIDSLIKKYREDYINT